MIFRLFILCSCILKCVTAATDTTTTPYVGVTSTAGFSERGEDVLDPTAHDTDPMPTDCHVAFLKIPKSDTTDISGTLSFNLDDLSQTIHYTIPHTFTALQLKNEVVKAFPEVPYLLPLTFSANGNVFEDGDALGVSIFEGVAISVTPHLRSVCRDGLRDQSAIDGVLGMLKGFEDRSPGIFLKTYKPNLPLVMRQKIQAAYLSHGFYKHAQKKSCAAGALEADPDGCCIS